MKCSLPKLSQILTILTHNTRNTDTQMNKNNNGRRHRFNDDFICIISIIIFKINIYILH